MKNSCWRLAAIAGFAVLMSSTSPTRAQVAAPLGTAQQFGVLGGSAVTGATGSGTVVSGDVGSSPTPSISNFLPSRAASPFIVHTLNDTVVQAAHADAIVAYDAMLAQGSGTVLAANLATVGPLTSGVYSFAGGAADLPASSTLTLNGGGIFIFNVASTLTANVSSSLIGTANPCNIYWRIGSSATLNGASFWGTVIANTSITIGDGANLAGRALAITGSVTMAGSGGNTIGGCSTPVLPPSCPTISAGPPTVPSGTVGVPYTQTLTASGGAGAYTFSVVSGTLPAGLTLSPAGVLAGTPTTATSATVTIRASDGNGCPGVIAYTIVIGAAACPVITLVPPGLPTGTVGVAYSGQISASGGTGPYTFSVVSGTLPAGLTLTSAGLLSGTPTAAGNAAITIRATDANACVGTITYAVVIASALCPVITVAPAGLAAGTVGAAYSAQISASGGTGSYAFTVPAGGLPGGLTLSSSGLLSGTPTTAGSFSPTVLASDGNSCPGVIVYAINIASGGGGGGGGSSCVPATTTRPTITSIANQVIPTVPARGSVAVAFTITGAIIPEALLVNATSSDLTLVPASLMVITSGAGGARVLTISGADGRTGVATITVSVTDPSLSACTPATTTSFQLTVGAVPVPTLPEWAFIALTVLLAAAGVTAVRSRQDAEKRL